MYQIAERTPGIRLLNKDLLHTFYDFLTTEDLARLLLDKEQAAFVHHALLKRRSKYGEHSCINKFFKQILNYSDKDFQYTLRDIADKDPVFKDSLYAGLAWARKTNTPFPLSEGKLISLIHLTLYGKNTSNIMKLFFHNKIPHTMKKEEFHKILDRELHILLSDFKLDPLLSVPPKYDFLGFCHDIHFSSHVIKQKLICKINILEFLRAPSFYSRYLKLNSPQEIDRLKNELLSLWYIDKAAERKKSNWDRLYKLGIEGATPINARFHTLKLLMHLPLNQEKELPFIKAGIMEALQESPLVSDHLKFLLKFLKNKMPETLPEFLNKIVIHNDFKDHANQVVFLEKIVPLKPEWIPHLCEGLLIKPKFLSRLNEISLQEFRNYFVKKACFLVIEEPEKYQKIVRYNNPNNEKMNFRTIIPFLKFEDLEKIFKKIIKTFSKYYETHARSKIAFMGKEFLIHSPKEITDKYFPFLQSYFPQEKYDELFVPLYMQGKLSEKEQQAYLNLLRQRINIDNQYTFRVMETMRENVSPKDFDTYLTSLIKKVSSEDFDTYLTSSRSVYQAQPKYFKLAMIKIYGNFASRLNDKQLHDAVELLEETKAWKFFLQLMPRLDDNQLKWFLLNIPDAIFDSGVDFISKYFVNNPHISKERKILFALCFFTDSSLPNDEKLQLIIFLMRERAFYNDSMVASALNIKLKNLNDHYIAAKNNFHLPQGFFAFIFTNETWNKQSKDLNDKAKKMALEYQGFFSNKNQVDAVLKHCKKMPLFENTETAKNTWWKIKVD